MDLPFTKVVGSYNFVVEIDGLLVAGFSEVTGLQSETEYEEIAEGGVNEYYHRLPKRTKLSPITLRRGISPPSAVWDLWGWYSDVVKGKVKRKNGSIILYDHYGLHVCRWNFFDAFPTKWVGPDLDASKSDVAIESIEIVHNGLKALHV